MRVLSVASLFSLISSIQAQNHVSNKYALFPNLGLNQQGLWDAFPLAQPGTVTQRKWGTVPEFCYNAANPDKLSSGGKYCNPYDIEVYEVYFKDCGAPWTFCRCNNAPWSFLDMVNAFGRIPVKARQYTRQFAHFADTGTHAYATGIDIAVFDNSKKEGLVLTLMFHENAHCVDIGNNRYSDDAPFVTAINNDQCVPDPYAKSNDIEDWAQLSVLGNYDLSSAGPITRYGNPACLDDQLRYVENTVGRDRLTPGGTCQFVYAKDRQVCMGPAAGCGNAGAPVASTMSTSSSTNGVPSKELPKNLTIIRDEGKSVIAGFHKLAREFTG